MSAPYPTFHWHPNFAEPFTLSDIAEQSVVDLGPARRVANFPAPADSLASFELLTTTRAEAAAVKEFFRSRGARSHPFMLPTWSRDVRPVGTAAEGDVLLTVEALGFETILASRLDTPGHYLAFWMPGETTVVTRVVGLTAATDETETVELATPVPFDLDSRAVVSFARFARFADERLGWRHLSPDVARVEIRARMMRVAHNGELTIPCEQIDQYAQLGFVAQVKTPENPSTSNTRVTYAPGPYLPHESQDWPYQDRWAVYPGSTRIKIRKVKAVDVSLPDDTGISTGLFTTGEALETDHLALAFDQNAFEVIAWQADAETVELRRWVNSEVDVREWPGIDPVVVWNGLLDGNLETGDTDVVCYYLKPLTNALFARFQRDDFETEYVVALLTFTPLELRGYRFADDTLYLEALDTSLRKVELVSATYPEPPEPVPPPYVEAYFADAGTLSLDILSADYGPAVVWADGLGLEDPHEPFADGATTGAAIFGTYFSTVMWADGLDLEDPHAPLADTATAGLGLSAVYSAVVVGADAFAESAAVGLATSGTYSHVVIAPLGDLADAAALALTFSAVYEPA